MSTETPRRAHDIETILKTYETALNGNDIETILGLYGDSPVFMPQHAPALVGRDAVRAGYAQVFDTIKLNVAFEIHEDPGGGRVGLGAHQFGRSHARSSRAGIEVTEGNNELFVFRREKRRLEHPPLPVLDQPAAARLTDPQSGRDHGRD